MSVYGFEHHLQSEIFARLRTAKSLRYSELRDPAMESSLFMYHLNELIRQKLVEKVGRGEYALAPAGVMLAQTFSGETGKPRQGALRQGQLVRTGAYEAPIRWYVCLHFGQAAHERDTE